MHRFVLPFLAIFLALPMLPAFGQQPQSGIEGHPPGQGRPADTTDIRYFGLDLVNQADTAFRYFLNRETPARKRPKQPGEGANWKPAFSGFDARLIRFTDSTFVPLKPGRTALIVAYAQYPDTLGLVIEQVGSNLVVDYDRLMLKNVRRERLYRVNTWDTIGGHEREKAMGEITIGMPIDQGLRLLKGRRFRTSSEFPGVTISAIDTRRAIYVEEKEGRVSKVWIGPSRLGVVE